MNQLENNLKSQTCFWFSKSAVISKIPRNLGSFGEFWVFGHRVIRKGCLTDWMLFFGVPYISSATGMHNGSNNQFYWEKSTDSSEIPRNSRSFGEFWIELASDKNSLLQKNNYNHSMRTIMKLVIRWSVMAESFPHIRVHFLLQIRDLAGGVPGTCLWVFGVLLRRRK